jgi:hypothetical protein
VEKNYGLIFSKYNPDILTSPMDKAGKTESLSGKLTWVKKNLGLDADKVNFAHDKYKFALSPDGKPNVLIDDFESKVEAFYRCRRSWHFTHFHE